MMDQNRVSMKKGPFIMLVGEEENLTLTWVNPSARSVLENLLADLRAAMSTQ